MDYQQISYEVTDAVATITPDRPDRLNAFTERMLAELIDALDRVDADDSVRAVIVTGRGRAFCAGADLAAGGETFHADGDAFSMERHADGGGKLTLRLFECQKPLIAAINGPAVGVGITMALPMDIRLAADTARIGFVFARRGLVPEAASSWFLPRIVGISQALEWTYSGRVFGAEEALAGGLVRSLHPADELLAAARAIATEIAEQASPVSVAFTRRMLWRMLGAEHPAQAHRIDSQAIFELGRGADAREGVTAFLDKRAARFPGRVSTDMPAFFEAWRRSGQVTLEGSTTDTSELPHAGFAGT
jgi:enoyl-CoA hydratase/carnithine racemase